MTQSEDKKPRKGLLLWATVAIAAVALIVVLALSASGTEADGKWLRVDPRNNSYPGDYLEIEGSSWTMTGNPAMSGTVRREGSEIHLRIEKVGEQTRAEAIQSHPTVEDRLKDLDAQLVFKIEKEGEDTILKQVGEEGGWAEWRFERAPNER